MNPLRGTDSRLNRPWAPTFQHVIGARPRGDSKDGSQMDLTKKTVCAVRVSSSHGLLKVFDFSKFQWTMGSPNELVEWIYSWGFLVVEYLNMIGHGIT